MAFLEWRRFTFFEAHKNVDNNKIAECLQDTNITVSTSGNNHVVICDETGWAHLISRSWQNTSFKAYEENIILAQQLPHDPYLVTIGTDEPEVYLIKVWDWSRSDRHGNPSLVRTNRAIPSHMKTTVPSALAINDDKKMIAVGFRDGSVTLYRGDITRQRSGKMNTISGTGNSAITGLAFKEENILFIVSRASVQVHWLGSERCLTLDSMGAPPYCSVLDKHQLMIATRLAIYCYTAEGRGPCYALEGDKIRLNWFRGYLVITTNETPINEPSASDSRNPKTHRITILDIQNKFIVFSKSFDEIDAVITEWGSFYILTKNKELVYLDEKDLQSKLSLLFKKNLYDVAIRIASSQHYDVEGLTEIYKQYGDHLYAKGDLKGAIDQYVKTIGRLETSYVIRKYLECRHLEPLIIYLEELHKKGYATEDHTTLLLTCYVKLDQHDQQGKLKEFINSKDQVNIDVDVAIKVVRQVSPDDALTLASLHKKHDLYLKIILEDRKDYITALNYIANLDFDDAELYLKRYGHTLIQYVPKESTELLKLLCTDYKPRNQPLVDESTLSGNLRDPDRSIPDDFLHLFLNNSELLIDFLEHMVKSDNGSSKLVLNALIEHYVHVWASLTDAKLKSEYENKIMSVLRDPNGNYDKDQILIICQIKGFKPGILHLYEEKKLWRAAIKLHLASKEASLAIDICEKRSLQDNSLWLDVLWHPPPKESLPQVLNAIANQNLLSPILVIDCLASHPDYTLGDVRSYLTSILKTESETTNRELDLSQKYKSECVAMKSQIEKMRNEPITFQSSRCAACNRPLELPSVHLLCQHSYHQHCFQSYSEAESECPLCEGQRNRKSEAPKPTAEALHHRMNSESDAFAVVSEYFGRGLFNKLTLVPEAIEPAAPPVVQQSQPSPYNNFGPGAEAKMRLQEGQSKQLYLSNAPKQQPPKGTTVIPVPEGRMRLLEQQQYSSSLEANLTKLPEPIHQGTKKSTEKINISSNIANSSNKTNISSSLSSNPFEVNYDETKNPFGDDGDETTNPFGEDDDDDQYNQELNPFAS